MLNTPMPDTPTIVYPDADRSEIDRYKPLFDRLRAFADFRIFEGTPENHDEFIERIRDANGVLLGWDMPGEVMRAAEKLRVISFAGIGVAQFVDMPQARQRGITVCNCPGYSNTTVAEHTMALVLGVTRHIARLDKSMRDGAWDQSQEAIQLHGKTIGLIGFGGIGQIVAKLCKAFGMHVLVATRTMSNERAAKHDVEFVTLDALYRQSDIISLHAAVNSDTENMVDHAAFEKMNAGAVLINTARAELVDENAFLNAIRSGKLAGAGLDVFWQEPLPADHPLATMNNVIISPHVGFNTQEAVDSLYQIAVGNLVRFFTSKPINVVT